MQFSLKTIIAATTLSGLVAATPVPQAAPAGSFRIALFVNGKLDGKLSIGKVAPTLNTGNVPFDDKSGAPGELFILNGGALQTASGMKMLVARNEERANNFPTLPKLAQYPVWFAPDSAVVNNDQILSFKYDHTITSGTFNGRMAVQYDGTVALKGDELVPSGKDQDRPFAVCRGGDFRGSWSSLVILDTSAMSSTDTAMCTIVTLKKTAA